MHKTNVNVAHYERLKQEHQPFVIDTILVCSSVVHVSLFFSFSFIDLRFTFSFSNPGARSFNLMDSVTLKVRFSNIENKFQSFLSDFVVTVQKICYRQMRKPAMTEI